MDISDNISLHHRKFRENALRLILEDHGNEAHIKILERQCKDYPNGSLLLVKAISLGRGYYMILDNPHWHKDLQKGDIVFAKVLETHGDTPVHAQCMGHTIFRCKREWHAGFAVLMEHDLQDKEDEGGMLQMEILEAEGDRYPAGVREQVSVLALNYGFRLVLQTPIEHGEIEAGNIVVVTDRGYYLGMATECRVYGQVVTGRYPYTDPWVETVDKRDKGEDEICSDILDEIDKAGNLGKLRLFEPGKDGGSFALIAERPWVIDLGRGFFLLCNKPLHPTLGCYDIVFAEREKSDAVLCTHSQTRGHHHYLGDLESIEHLLTSENDLYDVEHALDGAPHSTSTMYLVEPVSETYPEGCKEMVEVQLLRYGLCIVKEPPVVHKTIKAGDILLLCKKGDSGLFEYNGAESSCHHFKRQQEKDLFKATRKAQGKAGIKTQPPKERELEQIRKKRAEAMRFYVIMENIEVPDYPRVEGLDSVESGLSEVTAYSIVAATGADAVLRMLNETSLGIPVNIAQVDLGQIPEHLETIHEPYGVFQRSFAEMVPLIRRYAATQDEEAFVVAGTQITLQPGLARWSNRMILNSDLRTDIQPHKHMTWV